MGQKCSWLKKRLNSNESFKCETDATLRMRNINANLLAAPGKYLLINICNYYLFCLAFNCDVT